MLAGSGDAQNTLYNAPANVFIVDATGCKYNQTNALNFITSWFNITLSTTTIYQGSTIFIIYTLPFLECRMTRGTCKEQKHHVDYVEV
jgi:hypothetical protein